MGYLPMKRGKEFLRMAATSKQSSVRLQGSVRISQYVVSHVYEMHSILSLVCSGTSTISTKFHQALKLQIGFWLKTRLRQYI